MPESALVVVRILRLLQARHHIHGIQLRPVGEGGLRQGEDIGLQILGDGEALAQLGLDVVFAVRSEQALVEEAEEHPVVDVQAVVGVEALLREIGQGKIGLGGVQTAGSRDPRLCGRFAGPGHIGQAVAGGHIGPPGAAAGQQQHQRQEHCGFSHLVFPPSQTMMAARLPRSLPTRRWDQNRSG